jgi:hypothetical protein
MESLDTRTTLSPDTDSYDSSTIKAKSDITGISVHIGLNSVDPDYYAGWDGALNACEFDAKDMKAISKKQGFITKLLLTKNATHDKVMKALDDSSKKLTSGDHFILTYSGHGGQVPDLNGDDTEDRKDETWVLYDRELIDDELYTMFGKFEQGVRILVLSDSCHSGTVTKVAAYKRLMPNLVQTFNKRQAKVSSTEKFRAMPLDIQNKTYEADKDYYSKVQKSLRSGERTAVGACVLLISGCQDNQLSLDGKRNGAFTEALRKVWKDGKFRGGHAKFHREISRLLPPTQSPNYFKVGIQDIQFERMKPFKLGG